MKLLLLWILLRRRAACVDCTTLGGRFSSAIASRAFCAAGTVARRSLFPQAAQETGTKFVKATHGWSARSVV